MARKREKLSSNNADEKSVIFPDDKNLELKETEEAEKEVADVKIETVEVQSETEDTENEVIGMQMPDKPQKKNSNSADDQILEDVKLEDDGGFDISSEVANEKLSEAISLQKPQRKKKNTIVSLILLLVNIIFMSIIVKNLIKDVDGNDIDSFLSPKLWWLAGGVFCYVLYMLAQTLMFHALIKKLTGKSKWKLSYDVGLMGKYYDNVTPFAVGGQPMQIVRLASSGISPGVSTGIPLMKMMINSMISTLLALVFFIIGLPKIPLTTGLNDFLLVLLEILGIIGLIITLLAVLIMVLISTGSLVTRSLIAWIVKLGHKLKIVKNYRVTLKKSLDQASEYRSSILYLVKNKGLLFKMIIYSILETLSYACISFFVVMAFIDGVEMNWFMLLFICVVKYYICAMASSFLPLPGGTGIMEIAFIFLYGFYVGNAVVFALLAWRLLTYYLIIIHGFGHEVIRIIGNISKTKENHRKYCVSREKS